MIEWSLLRMLGSDASWMNLLAVSGTCIQCFDMVGQWAAGRAFWLWKCVCCDAGSNDIIYKSLVIYRVILIYSSTQVLGFLLSPPSQTSLTAVKTKNSLTFCHQLTHCVLGTHNGHKKFFWNVIIIIIIIRAFVRRTMSASELNLRRRLKCNSC